MIEGAHFLGTSGQNLDDVKRYTKNEDKGDAIQLLENTLQWRHMAPTTPDTLACFPYKSEVSPTPTPTALCSVSLGGVSLFLALFLTRLTRSLSW